MHTISKPLVGMALREYYLELAREDYYLRGGERPGIWHGGAAKLLNLTEKVEKPAYRNLWAGFTPDGKIPLVQNAGDPERQSAWDETYSVPKSVSTFWSQAPPEVRRQIEQVHLQAVQSALDYVEAVGGITRRGKGGKIREATPLLFALFEHTTNREQEPNLHTHALLFNLAFRSDGSTGTLMTHEIFKHKIAAGVRYRAELAKGLVESLGLEIEPSMTPRARRRAARAKGLSKSPGSEIEPSYDSFEIKAVPKVLCNTFSTRRKQIEKWMAERGLTSAIDAKKAAIATRRKKAYIPRKQLFAAWQEIGRQHGWSTPQVEELLQRTKTREPAAENSVVKHLFEQIQREAPQPDRQWVRRTVDDRPASEPERSVVLRDKSFSSEAGDANRSRTTELFPQGTNAKEREANVRPKEDKWAKRQDVAGEQASASEPRESPTALGKTQRPERTEPALTQADPGAERGLGVSKGHRSDGGAHERKGPRSEGPNERTEPTEALDGLASERTKRRGSTTAATGPDRLTTGRTRNAPDPSECSAANRRPEQEGSIPNGPTAERGEPLIEGSGRVPRHHPRNPIRSGVFLPAHVLSLTPKPGKEKSFLGFVIRYRWAFPYAPWWSPVRNLTEPYVTHKWLARGRRYGKIHAQLKLPFYDLQFRQKLLFPNAPKWSPVHGLSLPAIVALRSRRPPPQPNRIVERELYYLR